jgi:hypothetical protein
MTALRGPVSEKKDWITRMKRVMTGSGLCSDFQRPRHSTFANLEFSERQRAGATGEVRASMRAAAIIESAPHLVGPASGIATSVMPDAVRPVREKISRETSIGAGCRSRTRDLLITNQLLYQLS